MPFDCFVDRDDALNRRRQHIVARITPGIVLSAVILLLYCELVVPAIAWTTPSHNDVYKYSFMLDAVPFTQLYRVPRPAGWLAFKIGGHMPFDVMMWSFTIVGIGSCLAPLIAYQVLLDRAIPLAGMVLWSVLVVSYPGSYLGMVHDFGSRLALIFASCAAAWYVAYFRHRNAYHLSVAFVMAMLSFFCKETFAPMLFVLVAYAGVLCRVRHRAIASALATIVIALLLSFLHSRWVGSPFTSGQASYAIDLSVLNVVRAMFSYALLATTPQLLLALCATIALLAASRSWLGVSTCVMGTAIVLLSVLPNAVINQHGGCNYEMILVPLMAGLIVGVLDSWGLLALHARTLPFAVLFLAISGVVWGEYQIKTRYWWQMGLARLNQNVIRSLHLMDNELRSAGTVVVLGLQQDHVTHPWTPFTESAFLEESLEFHSTRFILVAPGYAAVPAPVASDRIRKYASELPSNLEEEVDLVIVFGADGMVWRTIRSREQIARLLDARDVDMTRVYDPGYWYDQVEPRLHPPKPVPSEKPR
jgi:hypothetical protein